MYYWKYTVLAIVYLSLPDLAGTVNIIAVVMYNWKYTVLTIVYLSLPDLAGTVNINYCCDVLLEVHSTDHCVPVSTRPRRYSKY